MIVARPGDAIALWCTRLSPTLAWDLTSSRSASIWEAVIGLGPLSARRDEHGILRALGYSFAELLVFVEKRRQRSCPAQMFEHEDVGSHPQSCATIFVPSRLCRLKVDWLRDTKSWITCAPAKQGLLVKLTSRVRVGYMSLATLRVPIRRRHSVDLELTKRNTTPPKCTRTASAFTCTVVLPAINTRPTLLHRNNRYPTLYICLSTTSTTLTITATITIA